MTTRDGRRTEDVAGVPAGGSASLAWIDGSAGVAGDMLCGALLDAGVPVEVVQAGVDAVIPGSTRLKARLVSRAGLRAHQAVIEVLVDDPPRRTWESIRQLLTTADLPRPVTASALRIFGRLAAAEGRVHGIHPDQVHFHEIGALDSIADVVAVCSALHALGITDVRAGPIAVGAGRVTTAHGDLPVPVPAVLELARGWRVSAGGEGELATPTGVAIVTTLARPSDLPAMDIAAVGVGAGARDLPDRPNVVRVVVGAPARPHAAGSPGIVIETNVDDMDPRVWPAVLSRLLDAGASDAWLTPILMKKGRPAHTLSVLAPAHVAGQLRHVVLAETSTIGLREMHVDKYVLDRTWVPVTLAEGQVRVKVAIAQGRVVHATPEFDDVADVAARHGRPVREVLEEAVAAAVARGLVPGAPAAGLVQQAAGSGEP